MARISSGSVQVAGYLRKAGAEVLVKANGDVISYYPRHEGRPGSRWRLYKEAGHWMIETLPMSDSDIIQLHNRRHDRLYRGDAARRV